MRTTVTIDDDVSVAVDRLRTSDGLGLREALNQLARAGAAALSAGTDRPRLIQPTVDLGKMRDVTNVTEALELDEIDDR